jgi:Tfp pilus assembly protein PilZ
MGGRDGPNSLQEHRRTLRVAFQTAAELRRELETNLARGGLFVPSREPAELREEVTVEVELAFHGTRVRLPAEVVAVVAPELAHAGGTPGVAVQILEPAAAIVARFAPLVGAPAPAPAHGERRRSPRRGARVVGRLASADASLAIRTRDLSHAGVLVSLEGAPPAPVGENVLLALVHPVTGQELEVEGTVVRHVESAGSVPALAVAFSTREASRPEVQRFVDDLQAASHARELGGIRGSLGEMGLAGLLQSFAAAAREGALRVARGAEEGHLVFVGRDLVGARLGSVSGTKALARMLAWNDGQFEFHGHVEDADRDGEPSSLDAALLDAARQLDERARLEPFPVRPDARFAATGAQGESAFGKTEAAILDLAGAGFTLRAMLDVIPDEDHVVLRALAGLLDRGVLAPRG